jgi:hypothetical protein
LGSTETHRALTAARKAAQRELLKQAQQNQAVKDAIAEVKALESRLMEEIRGETDHALSNPEEAARKPRDTQQEWAA